MKRSLDEIRDLIALLDGALRFPFRKGKMDSRPALRRVTLEPLTLHGGRSPIALEGSPLYQLSGGAAPPMPSLDDGLTRIYSPSYSPTDTGGLLSGLEQNGFVGFVSVAWVAVVGTIALFGVGAAVVGGAGRVLRALRGGYKAPVIEDNDDIDEWFAEPPVAKGAGFASIAAAAFLARRQMGPDKF